MGEGLRIYNLFPTLAGSIADWTAHLPRIAAMGFNAVYVNPFHYPGFSGSLYAVKDYYRLNPRFRGDEPGKSDDALLRDFTEAAPRHGLRVIMDLVVNHTSKDSELVASNPQWFARDARGNVRLALRHRPGRPQPEDGMGRSRRARLPAAAAATRSSPISKSWCGITSARVWRLSLRRRL